MSTLLPFLYQTQTLRCLRTLRHVRRHAALTQVRTFRQRPGKSSIPFNWEGSKDVEPKQPSTITPSEAQVFKGIFEEIAQGKAAQSMRSSDPGRSQTEQERIVQFREQILQRYPSSLRESAELALGLYSKQSEEPGSSKMLELEPVSQETLAERARLAEKHDQARTKIVTLMTDCRTDAELWAVLEEHVFSLPQRMGLVPKPRRGKAASEALPELPEVPADSDSMEIYSPLYSYFVNMAVEMFDKGFSQPSPYALQVLPRVKELGLASHVLAVSANLYVKLARIHWERHGSIGGALGALQEMTSTGLSPNAEVMALLQRIRQDLLLCREGVQGGLSQIVASMLPYNGASLDKLDDVYYNMQMLMREG
ncbi:hypothetical protein B0I35DRAFT_415672 [Stachybotrys elegans]|uniref:Mtf2-like C-terminal domain-containing protein n=1 Tax=Stachybotrys elegans TaxID=80388 RepID=A0A8K0WXE5_9HYPO|nr:hypothetical protein B0I35DRAFT_415672 [Stachybotrys elegans]